MMKKMLGLLMACCLLFSSASAAMLTGAEILANGNPDTAEVVDIGDGLPLPALPLVEEEVVLTAMFSRSTTHGDFETMWFLQQVFEETGIRLKIVPVESVGWKEKLGLSFASGDLPDLIIGGMDYSMAAKYGMAGMLQPMNELLEAYAPNAQLLLGAIPESKNNVTASDGNIYLMPAFNLTARDMIFRAGYINQKWIEDSGLEMPKTLDEFYACLVAFRDNDVNGNGDPSDEIPLSFRYNSESSGAAVNGILSAFGFVNQRHDVLDGAYVYVPMHENFRAYLAFMNKLYEEGLLDKEIFTQTNEQYIAKASAYRLGMVQSESKDYMALPEQKHSYALLGPLTSEYNDVPMYPAQPYDVPTAGMAITKNCQNPEAAVKLLDYLYSEHASFMTKCGPEKGQLETDEGWTRIVADDGSISYKIEYDNSKYTGFWAFRQAHGLMNSPFVYAGAHALLVTGGDPDATITSYQIFESGAYDARRPGYPTGVAFTEDEQGLLATYALLDTYVDQMVAKFVTGGLDIEDDAQWEGYLRDIEGMDVQTMIATRQEAYDRWAQTAQ